MYLPTQTKNKNNPTPTVVE